MVKGCSCSEVVHEVVTGEKCFGGDLTLGHGGQVAERGHAGWGKICWNHQQIQHPITINTGSHLSKIDTTLSLEQLPKWWLLVLAKLAAFPKEINAEETLRVASLKSFDSSRPEMHHHSPTSRKPTCLFQPINFAEKSKCFRLRRWKSYVSIFLLVMTVMNVFIDKGVAADSTAMVAHNDDPAVRNGAPRRGVYYGSYDKRHPIPENYSEPTLNHGVGRPMPKNENTNYRSNYNRNYRFGNRSYHHQDPSMYVGPNKNYPAYSRKHFQYPPPPYPYVDKKHSRNPNNPPPQGDGAPATVSAAAILQQELRETSTINPIHISSPSGHVCSFEEDNLECEWTWDPPGIKDIRPGFAVVNGESLRKEWKDQNHYMHLPGEDSRGSPTGEFLFMGIFPGMVYHNSRLVQIKSPWYKDSDENCRLILKVTSRGFDDNSALVKVLIDTINPTGYVVMDKIKDGWQEKSMLIGRYVDKFRIALEVAAHHSDSAFIAFDDIRLANCTTDRTHHPPEGGNCTGLICTTNKCVPRDRMCDFTNECPRGEDETNCDSLDIPLGARCDFENRDWCGWSNEPTNEPDMMFKHYQGPTNNEKTGPDVDHTHGNNTGFYLLMESSTQGKLGNEGGMVSPLFDPPPCYHRNPKSPFYKSCEIRFYYHKQGRNGAMIVEVLEDNLHLKPLTIKQVRGEKEAEWKRFSGVLPINIIKPYKVRIVFARGPQYLGDLGFDDFAMSPECFGISVPEEEKTCPDLVAPTMDPTLVSTRSPARSGELWTITSCGAQGRNGPSVKQCTKAYQDHNEPVPIVRPPSQSLPGYQTWQVPKDGIYMLIARGASGGSGVKTQNLHTKGGLARGAFFLKADQSIHVLVGQEGGSACATIMNADHRAICTEKLEPENIDVCEKKDSLTKIRTFNSQNSIGGGGGGGGATFVFVTEGEAQIPRTLLVAAGGGGLSWSNTQITDENQGGTNASTIISPTLAALLSNETTTFNGPGDGGSLNGNRLLDSGGQALLQGGVGGMPCNCAGSWGAVGGFGGGGGGCMAGGGGGGYQGGSSLRGHDSNGLGGSSFATGMANYTELGVHTGPGLLYIVRAVRGDCGCEYKCLYLDQHYEEFVCVCPAAWYLNDDGKTCSSSVVKMFNNTTAMVVIGLIIGLITIILCFTIWKCCTASRKNKRYREMQKNSNQNNIRSAMTEYNPNYDFVSEFKLNCDQIDRDDLHMTGNVLGKGSFGEVFECFMRDKETGLFDIPAAAKTLNRLNMTNTSEQDFRMEAVIMAKFMHTNIVKLLGISFDVYPYMIVLELLGGGDLKDFLKNNRPCSLYPERLTMKDLLGFGLDVASGCHYLETHHFIHRDIAARNCLLTCKGPGRIVKIADFGMSRDVYRSDYYRKAGQAMLPIKWMPPEAYVEGTFTTKSDVWAYGVFLWEVMTVGYMPYADKTNNEVVIAVQAGIRLNQPDMCPILLYKLMRQCWDADPMNRPSFETIIERLGYATQDPAIVNAPLKIFGPPQKSLEEIANEISSDPQPDYLIPLPSSCSDGTLKTDINSTPSYDMSPQPDCYHMDRLMQQQGIVAAVAAGATVPPKHWETSFMSAKPPYPLPQDIHNDPHTPLLSAPTSPQQMSCPNDIPMGRLRRACSAKSRGSVHSTHEINALLASVYPPPPHIPSPPPKFNQDTPITPPYIPEDSPLPSPLENCLPEKSPPLAEVALSKDDSSPSTVTLPMHTLSAPVHGMKTHNGTLSRQSDSRNSKSHGSSNNSSSSKNRTSGQFPQQRYKNPGSSNNSSSSATSSSTGWSSGASTSAGSGNSSASTLPLDPTSLPAIAPIPPPLQYVNVDAHVRNSDFLDDEPYVIEETREHREISC